MTVAAISTRVLGSPRTVPVETVMAALNKLPPDYLAEVMQFIEFLEFKSSVDPGDTSDDASLWVAVEANQAYKHEHPGEELDVYESGEDFLKAFADL